MTRALDNYLDSLTGGVNQAAPFIAKEALRKMPVTRAQKQVLDDMVIHINDMHKNRGLDPSKGEFGGIYTFEEDPKTGDLKVKRLWSGYQEGNVIDFPAVYVDAADIVVHSHRKSCVPSPKDLKTSGEIYLGKKAESLILLPPLAGAPDRTVWTAVKIPPGEMGFVQLDWSPPTGS